MKTTSAEVVDRQPAQASATATATATSPLRGLKRTADDSFDDDHRFAKRFNLLNLARPQLQTAVTASPPTEEHMQLDDTKHRVYIHNLDDELADIESDEEKLVFLPDIEKKLNAIPRHILVGEKKDSHQELVLYTLPPSLSVPLEQDNVRKAILEARERAKDRAALASSAADGTPPEDQIETAHGYDSPDYGLDEDTNDMEQDDDAMDLS
ncbi:hypothetical protein M436DRAFT_60722 [Aureobasidium namibiae CBS 147.97]|uniref:Uncharacterized protein n=1 Tax=Aureobasidium namibiae CBS 147.97 TaxID=1043004 RepID=A0A074WUR3_9PEZI|nr:uncharacterized protein M436DRAFT_60722 [Aureobasidium namibiae CBS 147.97]KEQ76923.1 hypothetical protein M436DRAFT_60722 [Aureobasidium namibiae CBS 147.97]